jgi:hypothetical protein
MSDATHRRDTRVLKVGARVAAVADVNMDDFGTTLRAGQTGTVEIVADNNCMVRLDEPIADAEEPANEYWTQGFTDDYPDARDQLMDEFAFIEMPTKYDPEVIPEGTLVIYDAHIIFEKGPTDSWTIRAMSAGNLPNVYEPGGITASEGFAVWAKSVVETFGRDEYDITP